MKEYFVLLFLFFPKKYTRGSYFDKSAGTCETTNFRQWLHLFAIFSFRGTIYSHPLILRKK